MPATILWQRCRPRPKGQVHVGRLKELELVRHDTDDRVRPVVDLQRLADGVHAGKSTLCE
jgi:hypothetical protein